MVYKIPMTLLPGERGHPVVHETKARRGSHSSRRSATRTYDNRPLVAVERPPPLKERIRRLFGMRHKEYYAYRPALTVAPQHSGYASNTYGGVRQQYSGTSAYSARPQYSGTSAYSGYNTYPASSQYRRTGTTRRRY